MRHLLLSALLLVPHSNQGSQQPTLPSPCYGTLGPRVFDVGKGASCFETIEQALAEAESQPGDIFYLLDGTHALEDPITLYGITIRGESEAGAVIAWDGFGTAVMLRVGAALETVTVRNPTGYGVRIIGSGAVRNSTLDAGMDGGVVNSGGRGLFTDCTFPAHYDGALLAGSAVGYFVECVFTGDADTETPSAAVAMSRGTAYIINCTDNRSSLTASHITLVRVSGDGKAYVEGTTIDHGGTSPAFVFYRATGAMYTGATMFASGTTPGIVHNDGTINTFNLHGLGWILDTDGAAGANWNVCGSD